MSADRPAFESDEFGNYKNVWKRFLQGWLAWSDEQFDGFVAELGESPSGVIFHEEPSYYVLPLLVDKNGAELPTETDGCQTWDAFVWNHLHRSIYQNTGFSDETELDWQWEAAKNRAIQTLEQFGFRLAVQRGQRQT